MLKGHLLPTPSSTCLLPFTLTPLTLSVPQHLWCPPSEPPWPVVLEVPALVSGCQGLLGHILSSR